MQINFFEEYPTQENLSKLALVDWSATVLIAAPKAENFIAIKTHFSEKYPHITFGWWPTLPGSYWVSGLSTPSHLDKLFSEIAKIKSSTLLPILLDLELPIRKRLFLKNIFYIQKNKNKISEFIAKATENNLKIYTAEYAVTNNLFYKVMKFLGLSPTFDLPHIKLPMCYSSMKKNKWPAIKNFEKKIALINPKKFGVGLGTIAIGVQGNEPILSPKSLEQDLLWTKSITNEVFIFRLGGLNNSYLSIIKKFL